MFFQAFQHGIHDPEAAGDGFRHHRFPREHAVARQELLRECGGPFRGLALEREPFRRAIVARLPLSRLRRFGEPPKLAGFPASGGGKASRSFCRHQRPSSFSRRRSEPSRAKGRRVGPGPFDPAASHAGARERPQRVKGVVGDEPLPDEIPQRLHRFGRIAAAECLVERSEE